MHVTSYLRDGTRDGLYRFIEAACALSFFTEVIPVRRCDGEIIAVTFFSSAADYSRMPEVVRGLRGILGQDIELASARSEPPAVDNRAGQVWFIRGRAG